MTFNARTDNHIPATTGMILAAGFGTRMRPLTDYMPKPLVPVCNIPMLENVLINLRSAGIIDVAVNSHHLSDQLADFIENSSFKDRVNLFHEPEILGTGGGIVNARKFLSQSDFFILHNGDILTDIDLSELLKCHYSSGNKVTMALTDGPENKVAVSDKRIYDILGKLGKTPQNATLLTYTGIMVISREIFEFLPSEVCNCSIITALLELMNAYPDSVGAYIPEDIYWNDLGTLPKYFQAHNDILLDKLIELPHYRCLSATCGSPGKSEKDLDCNGFNVFGKDVRTGQGAYLENCIILDDSIIVPGAFHCNQVIHPAFVVHRDELEIRSLQIMNELADSTVCSLQEQGSARGFYRIIDKNRTQILMVSDADDPDFERFINYGSYFGGTGKRLPEIYATVPDEFSVLIEDLGNNTLHRYINSADREIKIENIYCRVIDALLEFQQVSLDDAPELRVFKQDYLRWETAYFAENLLGRYCNIPVNIISNLDGELDLLAELVFDHGQVLIHRDFQSQNIMIDTTGRIRFVDYQGMRMGSPGYDIMSLALDPYAELSHGIRKRLIKYYQQSTGIPDQVVHAAGLQRMMQVLGAYGCLGLVKGKRQYLKYIPFAFSMLKELLRNPPLPMPRLTKLTDEISL